MKRWFWLLSPLLGWVLAGLLLTLRVSLVEIPAEPPGVCDARVSPGLTYGAPRSSQWAALRDKYVQANPRCEACGSIRRLNVHHVAPFHLYPERELDPTNLITLCREHHFQLGHHRDWKFENPNCRNEVAAYRRTHPWK